MPVDLSKLHPVVKAQAEAMLKLAPFPIMICQGFRSKAEQDALYAQGRTKPGKIVTNAPGGFSMHNYGLAFDVCGAGGNFNIDYTPLHELGRSLGCYLGVDYGDKPHFGWLGQWATEPEAIQALRRGEKVKDGESILTYVQMRLKGIFSLYTRPQDQVTVEKLAVFLNRFHEQIRMENP